MRPYVKVIGLAVFIIGSGAIVIIATLLARGITG